MKKASQMNSTLCLKKRHWCGLL